MRRLLLLSALMLLAAGLLAACGDDKKTFDVPGGGEISVDDDVPGDFPDDFPVYDGADVQGSFKGDDESGDVTTVIWETDDDIEDVSAFYEKEFEDGPWKSTSSGDFQGLGSFTVEKDGDDRVASVLISETDGKTTIVVGIGDASDLGVDTGDSGGDSRDNGDASGDDGDGTSSDDAGDDPSTGDAELPDEVDLDDDFPSDRVPLPDDARVTSSSSFGSGGAETFFVEFYSKDDAETVADYFKSELEGKGWTESFTSTSDGELFLSFQGENADTSGTFEGVTINVADADVEGYVLVSLSISTTKTGE